MSPLTPNRWLILSVLFVARTTMAFQFQSIASVSPLLVAELHINLAALGILVGAWMLPGVFVAIPGGLLGQRFGDKRVVLAALALMVAGSVLVATADGYGAALLGRVVSGTGAVLVNVLLTKMVADWFSGPQVATAMGIFVVSWPLGIGLSLLLLGPVSVHSLGASRSRSRPRRAPRHSFWLPPCTELGRVQRRRLGRRGSRGGSAGASCR